ncbi:MAG: hypothetical protein K9N09_08005 [Candidatus Cloacimonetes bacterium]|nr:hypothetical protein [Candidatus Cloacimonadota bacterium]MCF7813999.1 hypothetical protein [Candidatus Cloacimonadota bacterium]MCF7868627.1 hypothetical protein [Candidatus Cloacimonadota bacterium]MCF7882856.1 hypothetical protein [Candidatus Cloacimonadota bacterium]
MKVILAVFAAIAVLYFSISYFLSIPEATYDFREVLQPQNQPIQQHTSEPQFSNDLYQKVKFTPKANYQIDARLLHKKKYYKGIEAKTIPWDFALGWGIMSDPKSLEGLKVKQTIRFYRYSWGPGYSIPQLQIKDNSANCHLIPATKNLKKVMGKIKKDDVLRIEGFLVDVSFEHKRPYVWRTSTIRTDEGAGACETIYVKSIVWNGKLYR